MRCVIYHFRRKRKNISGSFFCNPTLKEFPCGSDVVIKLLGPFEFFAYGKEMRCEISTVNVGKFEVEKTKFGDIVKGFHLLKRDGGEFFKCDFCISRAVDCCVCKILNTYGNTGPIFSILILMIVLSVIGKKISYFTVRICVIK